MKCHKIADWLKDHPDSEPTREMKTHLTACPSCHEIWKAQSALEKNLCRLTPAEPPSYLKEKILAAIHQQDSASVSPSPYPAWAALVAMLALFLAWGYHFLSINSNRKETVAQTPIEIDLPPKPQASAQPPATTDAAAIYPVWPKHEDALLPQDLEILASIYPAPQPGSRVEVVLDDQDLSRLARVKGELVSLLPGDLKPGQHSLELRLCKGLQVLNSSKITFYLMEAPS